MPSDIAIRAPVSPAPRAQNGQEPTRPARAAMRSRPHTSAVGGTAAAPFGSSSAARAVTFFDMLEPVSAEAPIETPRRQAGRRPRAFTLSENRSCIPGGAASVIDAQLLSPKQAELPDRQARLSSFDSQITAVDPPCTPRQSIGKPALFPGLEERRGSASTDETVVCAASIASAVTAETARTSQAGATAAHVVKAGLQETMDNYMRRQTSRFLLWFPLTVGLDLFADARYPDKC